MTSRLFTLKPDDTVAEALQLMHSKHVRNIPVVDASGVFVGLFGLRRLSHLLLPIAASDLGRYSLSDLHFLPDESVLVGDRWHDIANQPVVNYLEKKKKLLFCTPDTKFPELLALLDNVTTVLLIAPVTLLICNELEIKPYPFLFAEILASNIGGTATLIGDPPNIMIGSAVGLSFNDFLFNLAPIVPLILIVTLGIIYLVWGRGLSATAEARERVMKFEEREAITDTRLLKQSLFVFTLVILGFLMAHQLRLEPATIALFGAAVLLLLSNLKNSAEEQAEEVHKIFGEIEWITIFFFIGLFIAVKGIEEAGVLRLLSDLVIDHTDGDLAITALAILWVSAVASAVVDNIPFVATMIPVIKSMAPTFGGAENLMPLWWSLALGACLGGNGSLVGASANLIVAGFAERAGHRIRFLPFMLMAFPMMLLSIIIASVYLYLRYL